MYSANLFPVMTTGISLCSTLPSNDPVRDCSVLIQPMRALQLYNRYITCSKSAIILQIYQLKTTYDSIQDLPYLMDLLTLTGSTGSVMNQRGGGVLRYTAFPYRVSTGPEQGFPCVLFPQNLKGRNLFSLQQTLLIKTGFSL